MCRLPISALLSSECSLAITQGAQPALGAATPWALAGGIGAFALSLAALHIGAEWTSTRDRSFVGRIAVGALTLTLAAAGGKIPFVGVVAAAVLSQLLLEAFTVRAGAATIVDPTGTGCHNVTDRQHDPHRPQTAAPQ